MSELSKLRQALTECHEAIALKTVRKIVQEALICKPMITVGVKYKTSSQVYTFMTDEECKVGDKAVVFTNGSWNVVDIVEVHDEPQLKDGYNYTWLVQVIDRTNYDRHIAEDGEGYPSVEGRL
jgi:hypothetical protein